MSTQSDDRGSWWPGLAALGLFAVMAWVFVRAPFPDPVSAFSGDAGITASIGYAMFNIQAPDAIPSEGFLVAFILIAVVLDAALDGAVMLATREAKGTITTALRSDAVEQEEAQVAADGGRDDEVVADGGRETEPATDGGHEEVDD